MANEWREVEWGEIATLEYGKSLRDYRVDTGMYRVFGTNGPIGWYMEPLCAHPGVIVGRKGAYRGIHFLPEPFFVIDTAFYLEPKQEMDLRWAYYCLRTYDINGMDSGSAIPSTSRESFYRLRVRVPPLLEQRAIAHILGSLDDKIELNRRMNATLEEMARALFQAWFVDFAPVRAKLELLAATGLRASEAAGLTIGDLVLGERSGWVTVRMGKGRKRRKVPLHLRARKALNTYLEQEQLNEPTARAAHAADPLFRSRAGEPLTSYALWYTVKKYARLADVEGVTPHTFRHTVATRLVRDPETDLVTAATFLGHSRVDTTARYSQPGEEDLTDAAERMRRGATNGIVDRDLK